MPRLVCSVLPVMSCAPMAGVRQAQKLLPRTHSLSANVCPGIAQGHRIRNDNG